MKKIIAVVLFAVFTAAGAFALPEFQMSAGAGGMFNLGFAGTHIYGPSGSNDSVEIGNPMVDGGGFIFFDATYAEISLGFSGGSGVFKSSQSMGSMEVTYPISFLNISLLLKYPFGKNDNFKIFPLLGIEYMAALSVKDGKDKDGNNFPINSFLDFKPSDFSSLMLKLGVGMDFSLPNNFYIRPELLLGFRFPSSYEKDLGEKVLGTGSEVMWSAPHMQINLAVGYRF